MRPAIALLIARTTLLRFCRRSGRLFLLLPIALLLLFGASYLGVRLWLSTEAPATVSPAASTPRLRLPGLVLLSGETCPTLENDPQLVTRHAAPGERPGTGQLLVKIPPGFSHSLETTFDGAVFVSNPQEDDDIAHALRARVTETLRRHRAELIARASEHPELAPVIARPWKPTALSDDLEMAPALARILCLTLLMPLLSGLGVIRRECPTGCIHMRLAGATPAEILTGLTLAAGGAALLASISLLSAPLIAVAVLPCYAGASLPGTALWLLWLTADIALLGAFFSALVLNSDNPERTGDRLSFLLLPLQLPLLAGITYPTFFGHQGWLLVPMLAPAGPGLSLLSGASPPLLPFLAGLIVRSALLTLVFTRSRGRIGRIHALRPSA